MRARRVLAFAPALLACAGLGCAGRVGAEGEVGEKAGALAVGAGGALAAGTGGALDVERYDLVGEFDWSQNRLYASVTVTLSAANAPPARVVLNSQVSAISAVHSTSGESLSFEVDQAAGTLAVELGAGAQPGAAFVVDYEASTPYGSGLFGSTPLTMILEREGDSNPARVMYTFAEPELARTWLPSHDDPADRAFFSVDLFVGAGERLIANGDLVEDGTGGCHAEGRMKYATSYSLPTYLMAFALGEFEVEEKKGPHGLPLSVWHRRGLRGNYEQILDDLDRETRIYEGLIGVDYPFEKYSLVLVPDFFGGEEHAGITFQAENVSTQPELSNDNVLTAHELAHQWFGDLVTVATWDDLWIKEGMASLLEWEGARQHLDRDGTAGAIGEARAVAAGEAVRDLALPPDQKYTSGPYDRAAWLLTQVRALAGETAFWGAIRQVLDEHRFGSVSSDAFLEAFRPALGDAALEGVRRALDAHALPSLAVEPIEGGARVTLSDPEGALIAPMQVSWHRENGAVDTVDLAPGVSLDLVRSAPGDFLVIDPPDLHPSWARLVDGAASRDAYFAGVAPLRVPSTEAGRERFLEVGGTHQFSALIEGSLPPMKPKEFDDFLHDLDSDGARATAVAKACEVALSEGGAWKKTVRSALKHKPFYAGLSLSPDLYAACSELEPPDQLFPGDWQALAKGLSKPKLSEAEVEYLLKFQTNAPEMLRAWSAALEHGYSTRVRRSSAIALAMFAASGSIGEADLPSWRARSAELLTTSSVPDVVFPLIFLQGQVAGPAAADNAASLSSLGEVLRTPMLTATHAFAGCTAFGLTLGDEAAWQAFAAGFEGVELSPLVAALLQDPAGFCGGG